MPLSYNRWDVPCLEVFCFTRLWNHLQVTPFELFTLQAHGHRLDMVFLTINDSRKTVLQTLVTKKQPQLPFGSCPANMWQNDKFLNSPYVTILPPQKRLNHNLMYTMEHTFGYQSKKFTCACVKSSAHAHNTKIRVGNYKYFETSVGLTS